MRFIALALMTALAACRGDQPQAPSAEQSRQLDESEAMLNGLSNEEGPEHRPGPSNSND
ncbi:MAG TPA: hypothetical protein VM308_06305 [Sphingomicrobium sp.]|nr:hypothetical protein [Sphingomicrobium sp.]